MAIAEIYTRHTRERITARWSGGQVLVSVNGAAEVVAFSLATETAIALAEDPAGRLWLVFADDTTIRRYHSSDGGRTWTQG
jgi:sugar lactone lactonase YvrE